MDQISVLFTTQNIFFSLPTALANSCYLNNQLPPLKKFQFSWHFHYLCACPSIIDSATNVSRVNRNGIQSSKIKWKLINFQNKSKLAFAKLLILKIAILQFSQFWKIAIFENWLFWKLINFSHFVTSQNLKKNLYRNFIWKFCMENFLHNVWFFFLSLLSLTLKDCDLISFMLDICLCHSWIVP